MVEVVKVSKDGLLLEIKEVSDGDWDCLYHWNEDD